MVRKLGKSHAKLVSSIYLKTLNIDKRYLAKEPDQTDIVYIAKMIMIYAAAEDMPRIHAYVYTATDYEGEPTETDEAIPLWTPMAKIPFDKMWQDDQLWLPQVLRGNKIRGWFVFEKENLLDHRLEINPQTTQILDAAYTATTYPAGNWA